MEFRAAPLILNIFNTLVLFYIAFFADKPSIKIVIMGLGLVLLSYGASKSHHYYTASFKLALKVFYLINIALSIYIYFRI
jgi:hypothetical protein